MAANNDRPGATQGFDRGHRGRMQSATVERIYRAAFGDDYPEDARPSAFYSRTTLQRLTTALDVGPGCMVVDLGCGHGGPSLWVVGQTGANVIGIDLSPVGIELAQRRAAEMGLSERAGFMVGDMTATGLPDDSCDAVMSLDVILFVPDKVAAVREVVRILRPGRPFVFTTWEDTTVSSPQQDPLPDNGEVVDYRRLLEQGGLMVETCEEPPEWRRQQRALAEGIVAAEADVSQEMGPTYVAMARRFLDSLPQVRYVFVVARRPLETAQ